jgi:2-methylcitrate dehydratase PrpD
LLAGTAAGLSLAPRHIFAQAAKPSDVMDALSAYMGEARGRALPEEVGEQAKRHLLDTLAAMISGSELPPGQAAQRYIREQGGNGTIMVVGSSLTSSAADAALANGVMAHADETDDSHNESRSHPGCSVVPAVRAVALGYDIGPRVVMAMGGAAFSYDSSLSTHSIAGTFGAAAAAACAAGLEGRQMRWLLDYAAQQSSGFLAWRRDTDHIEKAFVFAGMPARNGVTAALLVRSGWNGVDDIFSGQDNFFAAYAPKAQPQRLIDKLGARYEITQTDIKKWAVGSPIQGPLDAVEAIRAKHSFDADQVKQVSVRLAPSVAAVVDNRDIPDICLQHMIAVMLVDKTVSFHAAHDKARMQDPAVLKQRAKINLVRDDELAKLLPVRETVVDIAFADGSQASERVSAVRGTPRNPMERSEVIDKARDLIAPVLGRDAFARLAETVFDIERLPEVRSLRRFLQR